MTAVGDAVVVERLAGDERFGDAIVHDDSAHRGHRGRRSLGKDDEVWRDVVRDRPEPLADPAEAGDDLVGGEQDAVLVGDRPQSGPIPGGGVKQPPPFCTGSAMISATSSGPASITACSTSSSSAWVKDGGVIPLGVTVGVRLADMA